MKISNVLNKSGLRKTKKREYLLTLLYKAGHPLSHREIAEAKELASFDKVTIYRILAALQKKKLVHKVLGTDGVWRFCAHPINEEKKCYGNHPHFLCLHCKKMACLSEQDIPWIIVPDGTEIIGKQLIVYGLCPNCALKQNINTTE